MIHHKYIKYRKAPSDLRTIWEPSRFRWARPEDLAEGFASWMRANPVGLGPNWASSLEVSVRAINLGFLLEGARWSLGSKMRTELLRWLVAHGRHLLKNPEPDPTNHALGRALGLFLLGGYLRELDEAKRWFELGRKEFSARFPNAFLSDGTYEEVSPGYGAFVLEMGLIYLALAREWRVNCQKIPEVIQKALGFLADISHPDGSLPIFGDFDDGGVLRPRESDYLAYLSELASSLGIEVPEPRGTAHYQEGGFLVMREGLLHLVARVDDDPDRPGGHTHSDLGSFALWMREPLIVDPGVYLYTGPDSMREALRSETAHNLVWLEGRPMHIRDPQRPFTLEGRKRALFSGWESGAFVLRHDLFGPTVERRFVLTENGLILEDSVSEPGPWCAGFTLAPDVLPEQKDEGFTLRGKNGGYALMLEEGGGEWSVLDAFYCPRYGEKTATKRLIFRPRTMGWRIAFLIK